MTDINRDKGHEKCGPGGFESDAKLSLWLLADRDE